MSHIFYPLIASLVIMMISLSGVLFSSKKLGGWMEKNLQFLATFSIGIFAVIAWGLFAEALSHGEIVIILVSVLVGAILVQTLSLLIPDAHHHHDPHPAHSHSRIDARRIIMGDAIHNIGDGLLLVPAFIADFKLGVATSIGILLHEFVQEVSEYFILRESGYTMKEALIRNFFASGTIFIGVVLSLSLSSIEAFEAPLIGLAAGGFLFVITRDLIPHTLDSIKTKGQRDRHIQALLLGIFIMIGLSVFAPHGHEEIPDSLANEKINTYENRV